MYIPAMAARTPIQPASTPVANTIDLGDDARCGCGSGYSARIKDVLRAGRASLLEPVPRVTALPDAVTRSGPDDDVSPALWAFSSASTAGASARACSVSAGRASISSSSGSVRFPAGPGGSGTGAAKLEDEETSLASHCLIGW